MDNFDTQDLGRVRFYLVGNKIDLYKDREVTHEQVIQAIETVKQEFNVNICGNFEITCKWPHVVERTINLIIKDLVENGCYENIEKAGESTLSWTLPLYQPRLIVNLRVTFFVRRRNKKPSQSPIRGQSVDISKPLGNNKTSVILLCVTIVFFFFLFT